MYRCNLPNCAGCKPCCTDVDQKQPDPPTVIPADDPIKKDDPQPVTPSSDDDSGGRKSCYDTRGKTAIPDGDMLSCTKGGTRMCTNGEWRVTQGECSADEALAGKDQGDDGSGSAQPTVTPVYVGSSGQKSVTASASNSKGSGKKAGGKRHLLAPPTTAAADLVTAKPTDKSQGKHRDPCEDALPTPLPCPFGSAGTRNGKRHLLETQATGAATMAQALNQDPDLPCDANAGCPMDQSYWMCWPSSYRRAS
jgi:hypothetical protein